MVDLSAITPDQFAALGEVQTDTIGDVSRVKIKLLRSAEFLLAYKGAPRSGFSEGRPNSL